jgi:predicted alpha/beta-fold hydrolase
MKGMKAAAFFPPLLFRNPHLQTVLASSRLRLRHIKPLGPITRPLILDAGDGVRLLGLLSQPPGREARGLVVLLHGWEGSAGSVYIVRTAERLIRCGYCVFRLNFRDHGGSHHLNEGIFYASRLDEVFRSVRQIIDRLRPLPAFIVGFSLGGNFALRLACHRQWNRMKTLHCAVAISPVLDPEAATDRIDAIGYIRRYFLAKWRRSLIRKQRLFPHRYHLQALLGHRTVRGLTEALLRTYSQYPSAQAYFSAYAIDLADGFDPVVPVFLLTAEDDPIIAVEDFRRLRADLPAELTIHRYGGHNGFIVGPSLESWYESYLVEHFDKILGKTDKTR